MNLFRIDFIEYTAGTGTLAHSLADTASTRVIVSLTVSPERLQSMSHYAREPRRLVFECFVNEWIEAHLLSGDYELPRHVSRYEVSVYRDDTLFFSGIIDTSQLVYEPASGIISITCYDKLKLLSLFSDLTYNYTVAAGYTPAWVLNAALSKIEQNIDIRLPFSNRLTIPTALHPSSEPVTLLDCDYTDMRQFPAQSQAWTYAYVEPWGPFWGWSLDTPINIPRFFFANIVTIKGTWMGSDETIYRYKRRFRGRRAKFYNSTCPHLDEYDASTDWLESLEDPAAVNAMNEFEAWVDSVGMTLSALGGSPGLPSGLVVGDQVYTTSAYANQRVLAQWCGNIYPPRLFPGERYTKYTESFTNSLNTLQAMLLVYNATLYVDAAGTIILTRKDPPATGAIAIATRDILALSISRADLEQPDMSALDILAGETEGMQERLKALHAGFYGSLWQADVEIIGLDKYDIKLFSVLTIEGDDYYAVEVERDYINDIYKVRAWKKQQSE